MADNYQNIKKTANMTVMEVLPSLESWNQVNFPRKDVADIHTNYNGPSPYHVNYCGYEACSPGFAFGPHSRTSYLIHVVLSGTGTYQVGDKTYSISGGQIFLIYPGDTTTYKASRDDPWTYCWVGFSGHQSQFLTEQMGFSRGNHVITVPDTDPLRDCIFEMVNTHRLTYANELYRTSLLLRLFATIIENRPRTGAASDQHRPSDFAETAMSYIEKNFSRKIRISDLANYIGIDRSYLSKCFQAQYGTSPQEYLMRLRMNRAESMLRSSQESITAIAMACGYPDALAFTKMFKKRFGESPTEYRMENGFRPVSDDALKL